MHGRLDSREISDIGDTALSFSEVKALATGNPLLMDKAEADSDLIRLQRAERAWIRNQDALGQAISQHEDNIKTLTRKAAEIDVAISQRRDTRGDAFVMRVEGVDHRKRVEAGEHLKDQLAHEVTELVGLRTRVAHPGSLGGFGLVATVEQSMGKTTVMINLDGVPGGTVQMSAADLRAVDPAGLVTRLENRLHRLEASQQEAIDGVERARREITHARENLGQAFPQTVQLAEARERSNRIDEQLEQIVSEHQAKEAAPDQGLSAGADGRDAEPIRVAATAFGRREKSAEVDAQETRLRTDVIVGLRSDSASRPWRRPTPPEPQGPSRRQGSERRSELDSTARATRSSPYADWRDQVIRSGMHEPLPDPVHAIEPETQRSAERDCPEIGG